MPSVGFFFFFLSSSFPDESGSKNLGKFISSPTREKGNIQLSYSDGDECGGGKRINTNITLICKPGEDEGGARSLRPWRLRSARVTRPGEEAPEPPVLVPTLPRSPEMEKPCVV